MTEIIKSSAKVVKIKTPCEGSKYNYSIFQTFDLRTFNEDIKKFAFFYKLFKLWL